MSIEYLLEVDNITCRYGQDRAVDGLNFDVRPGSVTCLLGPSGCGKTTALRAIAGFQALAKGEIRIEGEPVSTPLQLVPPERRSPWRLVDEKKGHPPHIVKTHRLQKLQ